MIGMNVAMKLMQCFPNSFINQQGEFIAHRISNVFFNFATCENELDVKCKVLEWLSRSASKGMPYNSDRANKKFQQFMLDGINKFLCTNFSHDDIDKVYTYLGNRCNHAKTLLFIESGYDVSMLPIRWEDGAHG